MKRFYNLVYLRVTRKGDAMDFETIFSAEYGTNRNGVKAAARKASRQSETPTGQPFDLAAIEAYTETEMTTYNPLWLELYINGGPVAIIRQ